MKWSILAVAAVVGGCSGVGYIVTAYSSVTPQDVTTAYDTFSVFDKPSEGRMMVTSSVGAAFGNGVVGGLTLNSTNAHPPKPIFQEAAEQFLARSGRQCKITDGYVLVNPQWEFKYDCATGGA